MDGYRITKNDTPCHVTIGLNDRCKGKQLKESEGANYNRDLAIIFGGVGQRVTEEGLEQGSRDRTVRFKIMDERKCQNRDWNDQLTCWDASLLPSRPVHDNHHA